MVWSEVMLALVESLFEHLTGKILEAAREADRRHPGGSQEPARKHPAGSQDKPRRHPGNTRPTGQPTDLGGTMHSNHRFYAKTLGRVPIVHASGDSKWQNYL